MTKEEATGAYFARLIRALARFYKGADMTKQEALTIIKLLSALESWAFSTKNMLPDYLHDDLCVAVKKLEAIVLEKP